MLVFLAYYVGLSALAELELKSSVAGQRKAARPGSATPGQQPHPRCSRWFLGSAGQGREGPGREARVRAGPARGLDQSGHSRLRDCETLGAVEVAISNLPASACSLYFLDQGWHVWLQGRKECVIGACRAMQPSDKTEGASPCLQLQPSASAPSRSRTGNARLQPLTTEEHLRPEIAPSEARMRTIFCPGKGTTSTKPGSL